MSPLKLAQLFHETYERLAPRYGYETRPDTKIFKPDSPNGRLMIAVCDTLLFELRATGEMAKLKKKYGLTEKDWDYGEYEIAEDISIIFYILFIICFFIFRIINIPLFYMSSIINTILFLFFRIINIPLFLLLFYTIYTCTSIHVPW